MLKQKQFIAAVLVCCLVFGVIIASIYVIKLSKSLTNMLPTGKPLASFEQFHVIAHDLDEMGDLNVECKAQLGDGMRIADWNDIVAFYETGGSLDEFTIVWTFFVFFMDIKQESGYPFRKHKFERIFQMTPLSYLDNMLSDF